MADKRLCDRAPEAERLWAAGASMREIAAHLGTTPGSLQVRFAQWRAEGYDFPYRRTFHEPPHPHLNKRPPSERVCSKCGSRIDRRSSRCRECERERVTMYRQRPEVKARRREYQARYAATNREKTRAHSAVRDAVRGGVLVRPDICPQCGAHVKVHAHHTDYTRPLDVTWLCVRCHTAAHHGDPFAETTKAVR